MFTTFAELDPGSYFVTEEDYNEKYLLLYQKICGNKQQIVMTTPGICLDGSDHTSNVNAIRAQLGVSFISMAHFEPDTKVLIVT